MKKIYKDLLKDSKYSNVVLFILSLFLSIFVLLQSPSSIFSKSITNTDSSVFLLMANILKSGGKMYVDCFDHKGPILYLINLLGVCINNKWGIWIIEILFMEIVIIFFYKITKLNCSKKTSSIFAVITSFLLLCYFSEGFNFTEEYALLFQIISLYIFYKDIMNKTELSKKEIILLGICFAITALLRVNLVVVWIVPCIYFIIESIKTKKLKNIPNYIIFFLIGILVVFIPIHIYLKKTGVFNEFIQDYLLFNFKYAKRNSYVNIIYSIKYFVIENKILLLVGMIIVTNLIDVYKKYRGSEKFIIHLLNFLGFILTFIFVVQPGNRYLHYAITLVPFFALAFSNFYDNLFTNSETYWTYFISMLVIGLIVYYFLLQFKFIRRTFYDNHPYELYNYITENSKETDKILVCGEIKDYIYLDTNRYPSSKYDFLPYPILDYMKEKYYKDLEENKPKIIIVVDYNRNYGIVDDKFYNKINENYYFSKKINEYKVFLRK